MIQKSKIRDIEKLKRIQAYPIAYLKDYDFEREMVETRQRQVIEAIKAKKPSIVLEVGCGIDLLYTKALAERLPIKQWIIVEPIGKFIEIVRKTKQGKTKLDLIQGFFEDSIETIDLVRQGPIDFIVCSGMLHEVRNPEKLLQTARKLLPKNGILHVNVPNAGSLHRRLAKSMGLVKKLNELTARNKSLMQHQVFDINSLRSLIVRNGFRVENSGGYFIKQFSNKQMASIRPVLTKEVFNGLWQLGKEYPEFANEIYINAKIKGRPVKRKQSASPVSSWSEWFERSARHYQDPRMKMAYYFDGRPDPMKVIKAIHHDVWRKLKATKNSTLLDVGSGVGLFFEAFNKKLKHIVGTDVSLSMLRDARKLNPKGAFLLCDASSLPIVSQSFDRILCYSVFHYLSGPSKATKVLDEFTRVVKEGGSILIGDVLNTQTQKKKFHSHQSGNPLASRWWPPTLAHNLDKQQFSPSFFKNYCRQRKFRCAILRQNIPGKPTADSRYDVVIKT